MKRDDFLKYLQDNGCVIVRANKNGGYAVIRNVVTLDISGVPSSDPCYPATMCRICKTLNIDPPDEGKDAQDVIDHAHKKHGRG